VEELKTKTSGSASQTGFFSNDSERESQLEKRIRALSAEVAEVKDDLTQSEATNNSLTKRVRLLESELDRERYSKDSSQSESEQFKKQISMLKHQLDDLTGCLEEATAHKKKLCRDLDEMADSEEESKAMVISLKKQLVITETELAATRVSKGVPQSHQSFDSQSSQDEIRKLKMQLSCLEKESFCGLQKEIRTPVWLILKWNK